MNIIYKLCLILKIASRDTDLLISTGEETEILGAFTPIAQTHTATKLLAKIQTQTGFLWPHGRPLIYPTQEKGKTCYKQR